MKSFTHSGYGYRFWSIVIFLLVLLSTACSSTKKLTLSEGSFPKVSVIDSLCLDQFQSGQFPGMAIAIAHQGKSWSRGYGYADAEKQIPVDPGHHLFRIGSISKSVTASALGRMVEKRQIDLDAPVSTYLKDCPPDKSNLTLRQLGGHLACIRHYNGLEFFSNIQYRNVSDPLDIFFHDSLLCTPGTQFTYTTHGWTVISAAMVKAGNKPFLAIVQQEVSTPLFLQDLQADDTDSTHYPRVVFYNLINGNHVAALPVDNSNKWAGGGLLCSAEDLVRYGYAHVVPGYLRKKTLQMLTQSQVTLTGEKTNYGIGFGNGTDDKGRYWFGHSGGSVGGTSMLLIYPDHDLVVVTLVNQSSAGMNDLARKIGEVLLGE